MVKLYPKHLIIEDIGSGLNLNKRGIKKIINDLLEKGIIECVEIRYDFKNTKIRIFMTRPDTIFGASFIAIAPDHPFTESFKNEKNFQAFKELALKNIGTESSLSKNEKLGFKTQFFGLTPITNPD